MNEAGLPTGVVGVPVTYPVRPQHGHMVAGLLPAGLHSPGAVYPSDLPADIK
jgi:predicted AlkP superfamily phosphohydrolase/phosphomutase